MTIRDRIESHAAECRTAMARGEGRPDLPEDLRSIVGANLDGAKLDRARLYGARLVGASLVGASLVDARLDDARLDGANLTDANLDRASLVRAILDNVRLPTGVAIVPAVHAAARPNKEAGK